MQKGTPGGNSLNFPFLEVETFTTSVVDRREEVAQEAWDANAAHDTATTSTSWQEVGLEHAVTIAETLRGLTDKSLLDLHYLSNALRQITMDFENADGSGNVGGAVPASTGNQTKPPLE